MSLSPAFAVVSNPVGPTTGTALRGAPTPKSETGVSSGHGAGAGRKEQSAQDGHRAPSFFSI